MSKKLLASASKVEGELFFDQSSLDLILAGILNSGDVRGAALFSLVSEMGLRGREVVASKFRGTYQGLPLISIQKYKCRVAGDTCHVSNNEAVHHWIETSGITEGNYLFPGDAGGTSHLSLLQLRAITVSWLLGAGLETSKDTGVLSLLRRSSLLQSVTQKVSCSRLDK